jgi:hypothetical protein
MIFDCDDMMTETEISYESGVGADECYVLGIRVIAILSRIVHGPWSDSHDIKFGLGLSDSPTIRLSDFTNQSEFCLDFQS